MTQPRPKIARLSDWHRVKQTHELGCRVEARVDRHVGFGALCWIGGNFRIPARLRKREISWDPNKQDPTFVPEGSLFDAIVIGYDDDWRELVISKKAADKSAITQFAQLYGPGAIVECEVCRITPSRTVIVALAAGLEGEIAAKDLPVIPTSPVQLLEPWRIEVGDQLQAMVVSVDTFNRSIRLSLKDSIGKYESENRQRITTLSKKSKAQPYFDNRYASFGLSQSKNFQHCKSGALKILLVEDESDVRDAITSILRDRRHLVFDAGSLEVAKLHLSKTNHDAALIDLHLSGKSAESLILELRRKFPGIRIIVVSGNTERLSALRLTETILPKPFDPWHVVALLEGNNSSNHNSVLPLDESLVYLSEDANRRSDGICDETLKTLRQYLQSMQYDTGASASAILSYGKSSNEVTCVCSEGIPKDIFGRFRKELRSTFFGDVLAGFRESSGSVCASYVANQRSQSQAVEHRLLSLTGRERAIGFPMQLETQRDSMAIFLFMDDERTLPSQTTLREIEHRISVLCLEIDRSAGASKLLRQQRSMSVGSLMLGMTHELRNAVTAIKCQTAHLETVIENVKLGTKSIDDSIPVLASFSRQTQLLEDSFESMLGLSKVTDSKSSVALESILQNVFEQCRHVADQSNILLITDTHEDDSVNQFQVHKSLGQVVLNLVLNAIQHTSAWRKQDGCVEARMNVEYENAIPYAVLRVSDNGFGMDWLKREEAFEMFQTTRRDGSGLGLYVSRLIVESLGGRIYVESSYKFQGTTMRVEFAMEGIRK